MLLLTANIFQPLIDVFEAVLKFFHNTVGVPWGWSIVLLTITVRAALIPLTVRQIKSMARMQQLQPELKLIQSKYKEDKQRQQQEMMKFYKDNKVNPLGSCLPLVAQLPVFVSLYYMLRQSLRADICPAVQPHHIVNGVSVINTAASKPCGVGHGAGFLFIGDLTNKASGATLIILILLYVGTQLGSTLMMSGATVDPTQRKIMLFMPIIFVLFVIRFPAGVLVYWITTNAWTIGQQYVVRRRIGPVKAVTSTALATNGSAKAPSPSRSGPSNGASKSAPDGQPSGGLTSLIRRAAGQPAEKAAEKSGEKGKKPTPVGTGARGGPPPRSPRKKKKRSGRRR
jgi:YidC/Oxa1 family membrane protein insertase